MTVVFRLSVATLKDLNVRTTWKGNRGVLHWKLMIGNFHLNGHTLDVSSFKTCKRHKTKKGLVNKQSLLFHPS